jgi:hypothetical protein
MGHLNVNPAQLLATAVDYDELSVRTALLSPRATAEVQRIADSHGLIGYPTALGVAAALANAEQPVMTKAADFQTYSQHLTEHAATYTDQDERGARDLKAAEFHTDHPESNVGPRQPQPNHPKPPLCYIGAEGADPAKVCPPETDTVTYVDKDGNYVSKDLQTGVVTVVHRPGPVDGDPSVCFLPSAGADRSICGPGTTTWMYPRDGQLITDELGPDGKVHTRFQTPPGPLIP